MSSHSLHRLTWIAVRCSGLHFTAAVGSAECTRMLCEAGADIDLGDKQGDLTVSFVACPEILWFLNSFLCGS